MPQPVRDKLDQRGRLAQLLQNAVNELQVRFFVAAPDVVYLPRNPRLNHPLDRGTLVVYMQPIAHVQAVAVYGKRLAWVMRVGISLSGNWKGP